MRTMSILNSSILLAGCTLLGACAGEHARSTAEPVIVHTDGDAATLLTTDPYHATHVKIGARWFPRCQQFTSLGSRTDTQIACMSDAEIREFEENSNAQRQEFLQRSGTVTGSLGNN